MVEAALIKGFVERRGREVWQFGGLGVKRSGHFPARTSFRIKVPTSRKGREKWGTRRFRPAASFARPVRVWDPVPQEQLPTCPLRWERNVQIGDMALTIGGW